MHDGMKQDSMGARELASALVDGELQGAEFTHAMAALRASDDLQTCWRAYHLVGDAMRSGMAADSAWLAHVAPADPAFVLRLRERLQAEAPRLQGVTPLSMPPHHGTRPSANDAAWRWKLVAGLSSLALVMVLGVQLRNGSQDAAPVLAQQVHPQALPALASLAGERLAAGEAAPVMIRDPQLDRFIAEHQQLGSASALQMPAGFMRNATFERSGR